MCNTIGRIRSRSSAVRDRTGPGTLLHKGAHRKYAGSEGHTALGPLYKCRHGQAIDKWASLCSNKTLFTQPGGQPASWFAEPCFTRRKGPSVYPRVFAPCIETAFAKQVGTAEGAKPKTMSTYNKTTHRSTIAPEKPICV